MQLKKHGDTIIEVMMAIAIFALLSVITISLMNSGINNAQHTLEYTMARNEIDNQAEALRYIHQSYVAERQLDKKSSQFRLLWDALRAIAKKPSEIEDQDGDDTPFDINKIHSCNDAYAENNMVARYNAFVLNTRLILPDSGTSYDGNSYQDMLNDIIVGVTVKEEDGNNAGARSLDASSRLTPTSLYPRIIYKRTDDTELKRAIQGKSHNSENNNETSPLAEKYIYNRVERAEGIFIIAVGDNQMDPIRSNYFDFYIRSCWHSVGSYAPSTITTIVRLYNPEVIE